MGHVFTANMTGNIVFLGFAFGGLPGLSIGRSATALGFALLGGFLAGRLDSWLGKKRRNLWLVAALDVQTFLPLSAMTVSWHCGPSGGGDIPSRCMASSLCLPWEWECAMAQFGAWQFRS
jgi:hypothetical protein